MSLPFSNPRVSRQSVSTEGEYVSLFDGKSLQSKVGDTKVDEYPIKENTSDRSRGKVQGACGIDCSYKLSRTRFFHSSRQVKKYAQSIMLLYADAYREIKFPIFPEKTGELNHLSAQLWITTYAMQDIADDLAEAVDIKALNDLYIRTIMEGNLTGKAMEDFYPPLEFLAENGIACIEKMRLSVDLVSETNGRNVKVQSSGSEDPDNKISPKILAVKKSLLIGSRIQADDSFKRLKVYMRTSAKRKWFSFSTLPRTQRLSIIKDSLGIVGDSFGKLRKLMAPILRMLEAGVSSIFGGTLLQHLIDMKIQLLKMSTNANLFYYTDEREILDNLRRVEDDFNGIIGTCQKLLHRIMEVIGMTRLCYVYLINGLSLGFTPFENLTMDFEGTNLSFTDFEADDFLKTGYPDILRKVPTIIDRTELSLHKQVESKRLNSLRRRSVLPEYL